MYKLYILIDEYHDEIVEAVKFYLYSFESFEIHIEYFEMKYEYK